jgi:hypothetical protein
MHPVYKWLTETRKIARSREFDSVTDIKDSKTFRHLFEIIQRS